MTQVAVPTAVDVLTFLGWDADSVAPEQIEQHLAAVTRAARAYTRGQGWWDESTCAEGIASAIVTATARSLVNPSQERSSVIGAVSSTPGVLGWSIHERAALDMWRTTVVV
ncbi:hypothetical protein [Allobranchiibius sp. CTAmp26]|uniref:hypothetical protein n=1 Tax=Allobranchiibius sp. CTAmp26 TaxID=2815214 RepID=UPI001AA15FB1|nr:hypothetical protein [Allobranchiibius sp. CTAmp26]MBO1755712.1 hypothetical protein [Allobranchiibius sp. CTAmp26]